MNKVLAIAGFALLTQASTTLAGVPGADLPRVNAPTVIVKVVPRGPLLPPITSASGVQARPILPGLVDKAVSKLDPVCYRALCNPVK